MKARKFHGSRPEVARKSHKKPNEINGLDFRRTSVARTYTRARACAPLRGEGDFRTPIQPSPLDAEARSYGRDLR
jgi:hypothetical protein